MVTQALTAELAAQPAPMRLARMLTMKRPRPAAAAVVAEVRLTAAMAERAATLPAPLVDQPMEMGTCCLLIATTTIRRWVVPAVTLSILFLVRRPATVVLPRCLLPARPTVTQPCMY